MRYIKLPGTEINASSLGFGCASLGSRVSKQNGLRALARAYDEGVTWYDLAPIYGGGLAEGIFSEFLAGRRERIQVCTKVGVGRPSYDPLLRMAGAVIRPIVNRFGFVHNGLRRVSASQNINIPITPELIEKSIQCSLKRMRTDYVDVFALHDPSPKDVVRDDVLEALQKIVNRGQARYISVAGRVDAIETAIEVGGPYRFLQFADGPNDSIISDVRDKLRQPMAIVTHSILGVGGAKDTIVRRLNSQPDLIERLKECGYRGAVERIAVDLLMDRAFTTNPTGVVLASMFSEHHLENNVGRANATVLSDTAAFLTDVFSMPTNQAFSAG